MDKFDSHKVLGLVSIGFHWFPGKQHGFHSFFFNGGNLQPFFGPTVLDGVKAPAWQSGRSHSQGATINLLSESITIKQSLSFQYWTYHVYYIICILCIF